MNIKKILFTGTILSCLCCFTFAQPVQKEDSDSTTPKNLTIEDAVNLALENNLSIKQSKMQLDLLEKQDKYSWNSVSPSLSLGGGVNDSLPTANTDNSLSYSVSASASARFTPSLFTTMKAAKIALETGEISYETALRTVEMEVRRDFYSLLNMKETIESSQLTLEAAKRTYESNLQKYNRGQLDQLTLLTSQYNYERLVPSVDSAKLSYQNSVDSLKQILGINLTDEIILEGSLDDVLNVQLDEEILRQDMDNLPDIKTLQQSIKSAENSLQATKFSAYGPSVSLSYSYSGGGSSGVSGFSNRNSIALNVSVPLDGYLPWSSGELSIENQEANLENLKLQLENKKTTLAISIRNSYNTIQNAQNQLKAYESNLELMQKTYDMTLLAYNNGSKDLNALETAQDNLSSARYSLQNQKYTIINAVLNLENTLGIPFGSLNQKSENKSE